MLYGVLKLMAFNLFIMFKGTFFWEMEMYKQTYCLSLGRIEKLLQSL